MQRRLTLRHCDATARLEQRSRPPPWPTRDLSPARGLHPGSLPPLYLLEMAPISGAKYFKVLPGDDDDGMVPPTRLTVSSPTLLAAPLAPAPSLATQEPPPTPLPPAPSPAGLPLDFSWLLKLQPPIPKIPAPANLLEIALPPAPAPAGLPLNFSWLVKLQPPIPEIPAPVNLLEIARNAPPVPAGALSSPALSTWKPNLRPPGAARSRAPVERIPSSPAPWAVPPVLWLGGASVEHGDAWPSLGPAEAAKKTRSLRMKFPTKAQLRRARSRSSPGSAGDASYGGALLNTSPSAVLL